MPTKRPRFTCIDLFAGCGGLSLGLEQAGFEPLAMCELSPHARESYLANRKHLKKLKAYGDVAEMSDEVLEKLLSDWNEERRIGDRVDLVCGGPPCQGYSGIGHRRSYIVERREIPSNHLYQEMIRVIRKVQPRAFLFENVKGLKSGRWTADGRRGEIWSDVLRAFESIEGYQVRHAVLQAKDYGVPQNRPRVIIVGVREDLGWSPGPDEDAVESGLLPKSSGTPPGLEELLSDLDDAKYREVGETTEYLVNPKNEVQKRLRTHADKVMGKGHRLTEQFYSRHSSTIHDKFTAMHANNGVIPPQYQTKKFAQRLLPRVWGKEGPNITATSLSDDFVHYARPRVLTVREWARLQTFPDWYEFRGPRTTGGTRRAGIPTDGIWDRDVPRYTQIGNAVPVWLAEAIGKHLVSILEEAATRRKVGAKREGSQQAARSKSAAARRPIKAAR